MPAPAPFSSPQNNLAFPALYLYPLNDSFIPKHISLTPSGQRVKIGRQTNAKTSPGERNGYFDSKVLSRQHAEVWEEGNKIFIKDVKSSNGTFINGERLSLEGVESEPFELKSDDIVEFGIDIVGEDNKTIIHHKVAARVSCVFTEQQVAMAARAEQQQNQGQYSQAPMLAQPGPAGSSSFNFGPGGPQAQRRPQMPHQGLNGMGGMGGSVRPPGKSGLTFDHILSRLQGELTKSRETGQDLQTLSGAMNDIQDTLGGSLPPTLPPYPHVLPPVRPPPSEPPVPSPPQTQSHAPENSANGAAALSDLQSQLTTTQSSLATHVDKIRALEGVFAEQEAIKEEVRALRDLVGVLRQGGPAPEEDREPKGGFDSEEDDDDDDSDARSVATVTHPLERVDEEDEEEDADDENANFTHDEDNDNEHEQKDQDRAMSPDHEQDVFHVHEHDEQRPSRPRTPEPTNMGMARTLARSTTLRSPLGTSADSSSVSPPTASVTDLAARLALLSTQLESALALSETLQQQHAAAQRTIAALEDKVRRLEGLVADSASYAKKEAEDVRAEWATERERLRRAREEWEERVRGVVDERIGATKVVSYPLNGGLATPPSPRSLSADSGTSRRRRRSRGRSGSPRGNGSVPGSPVSDTDDAITELARNGNGNGNVLSLVTPESSVHAASLGPGPDTSPNPTAEKSLARVNGNDHMHMQMQTAIGVLVLSVAAAAVIWRVKPE
ncbi:hypothetical protein DFH09DRAFT_1125089 [Mycena vulgaris]|nr:hypothetical protein DFH09DRAFT_1125089 [Mycena vulgaris]